MGTMGDESRSLDTTQPEADNVTPPSPSPTLTIPESISSTLEPSVKKKIKYEFNEPPDSFAWAVSFAKKFAACGLCYILGYFQISIGWLIIQAVMLEVGDRCGYYRETTKAVQSAAARDEREVIMARLGEPLPSWVVFPNVERADWLNIILKRLWPKINHYVKDLVVKSIEPGIRDTLATSYNFNSFKFEKVVLGSSPIRIRGVKVYNERRTNRNEIVMDMEVFYAGDCDVRFSLAKFVGGIKDLQLHGTIRIVMHPLTSQMPFVGGIHYYFLNEPTIDFNLVGAAGVLDMPGLASMIRRVVQEQTNAMCVFPNKMFLQLVENIKEENCTSAPIGIVRVCAIEAANLLKKDVGVLGKGKSDPYVILKVANQTFKSKTILNTVAPKWNFYCEMLVEDVAQKLTLTVWDFDDLPMKDEFLGKASVDLSLVKKEGDTDIWIDLEEVRKGQIHLKLNWFELTSNPEDLITPLETQNHRLSSCVLTVTVDSAKNLPMNKKGSKPDPFVVLSVGKNTLETPTLKGTTEPVFEHTGHILVRNPRMDSLLIKIMDRKTGAEIGFVKQELNFCFSQPEMAVEKQRFALNTGSGSGLREACVILDMQIRVFKHYIKGDENGEEYSDEDIASMSLMSPKTPSASVQQRFSLPDIEKAEAATQKKLSVVDASNSPTPSPTHRHSLAPTPSILSDNSMRILLTIQYTPTTHELSVTVHKILNIITDNEESLNVYVKLYILPKRNRKHKTDFVKHDANPVFDDKFALSVADLTGKVLEVSVSTKKNIRLSIKLGQCLVHLDEFSKGGSTSKWYQVLS